MVIIYIATQGHFSSLILKIFELIKLLKTNHKTKNLPLPMQQYSQEFRDLVNQAAEKTEEFYQRNSRETPNPFYIGKGNPEAKILIIGRELAIDPKSPTDDFKNESVENPLQWKNILENKKISFNPHLPYGEGFLPSIAGSTWRQYQRLCDLILPAIRVSNEPYFFHNFFITEANITPSKYSPGRGKIDFKSRLEFFENNRFYQNFEVIIVAAGGYLHVQQIEELFGVKKNDDQSTPNNKFITFRDEGATKLVISTRQLSMAVSQELMDKIANEVNSIGNAMKAE